MSDVTYYRCLGLVLGKWEERSHLGEGRFDRVGTLQCGDPSRRPLTTVGRLQSLHLFGVQGE